MTGFDGNGYTGTRTDHAAEAAGLIVDAAREVSANGSDALSASDVAEARDEYLDAVRAEQRKKDAQVIKAEIERLELVKGTYAQGQRRALGVVWAAIRTGGADHG